MAIVSTLADIITSDVQTTFSTPPQVGTALSSDDSTKLASIGYLTSQSITNATYLDITSNQTITGTYTIDTPLLPNFISIDTPNIGDTLTLGKAGDTRLQMILLTLKGVVQKLVYWATGNQDTTVTIGTGTAVNCQKVQTGQLIPSPLAVIPVVFSPPFTAVPAILLSVQRTGTASFTPLPIWVTDATVNGFTINQTVVSSTYRLNWLAIGT